MRNLICGFALGALLAMGASWASASTITLNVGGTLFSTSVDAADTVFANATTGDAFSLVLTYDPSNFATTASLEFQDTTQSESASLANSDGTYTLSSPGAYGAGTTSFNFSDSSSDFINLYFNGAISGPGDVAGLNALTGYSSASPSEFEWLFNFSDGGQTDLQGSITSVSASETSPPPTVPEPATFALLAPGLLLLALFERRRRAGVRA